MTFQLEARSHNFDQEVIPDQLACQQNRSATTNRFDVTPTDSPVGRVDSKHFPPVALEKNTPDYWLVEYHQSPHLGS